MATSLLACSDIQIIKQKPQVNPSKPGVEASKFCALYRAYTKRYGWGVSNCTNYNWAQYGLTPKSIPLLYTNFSNKVDKPRKVNTTLLLCGVHGDEITPVKLCFDMLSYIKKNRGLLSNSSRLIIAPLVNPDSFFKSRPTRQNANGVDVNRNFPTKDWSRDAIRLWKGKYKQDPRRNPGPSANSEIETRFQIHLIEKYKPSKIITVHAPLKLIDYDGPQLANMKGKKIKKLLHRLSEQAKRYKLYNYPFFTGSLGNWAGNERAIPTLTLELPDINYKKTTQYFTLFREPLIDAINTSF